MYFTLAANTTAINGENPENAHVPMLEHTIVRCGSTLTQNMARESCLSLQPGFFFFSFTKKTILSNISLHRNKTTNIFSKVHY